MTSRVSSHNQVKSNYLNRSREYRRHHLAEILVVLFFVFMHLLGFVIYLQNVLRGKSTLAGPQRQRLLNDVLAGVRPNQITVLTAGFLGALIGLLAFRYLHSKTKLDFFHSLPIRRIDMYKVILGNVFLIFLIPVAVCILLELVICAAAGYFTQEMIVYAGMGILLYSMCFMLCFLSEGLAMVLTGNLAAGFLGGCVFAFYFPLLLYGDVICYMSTFFKTFCNPVDNRGFYMFSPLSLCFFLLDADSNRNWPDPFYFGMILVWIVVLVFVVGWLFIRRPSERAGQTMAFPKIKTPLRFLLVVPMSLFSGWALYQITLEDTKLWMVAGIIISAVFFHGLVEAVYQMDVRGLWSKKKQLGITILICLAIAAAFRLDLFGYDSYLPRKEQLSSIRIIDGNLTTDFSDSRGQEVASGLTGEDMDIAYAFLQDVVESRSYDPENSVGGDDRAAEGDTGVNGNAMQGDAVENDKAVERNADVIENILQSDSVQSDRDSDLDLIGLENDEYNTFTMLRVTYRLKDNKAKVREYPIPIAKYKAQLDELYGMEEYKRENSVLYDEDRIVVREIWLNMNVPGVPYGLEQCEIQPKDKEEFLSVYRKDFTRLTYSEMTETIPVGSVDVAWIDRLDENAAVGEAMDNNTTWSNYYIYPSFTETISWLTAHGCMKQSENLGYRIRKMDVTIYGKENNEENASFQTSDPVLIQEVEPELIPVDLADVSMQGNKDICYDISIEVEYVRGQDEYAVTMRTDKETARRLLEFSGK